MKTKVKCKICGYEGEYLLEIYEDRICQDCANGNKKILIKISDTLENIENMMKAIYKDVLVKRGFKDGTRN